MTNKKNKKIFKHPNLPNIIWDAFFPIRCPICTSLVPKHSLICPQCYQKISFVSTPFCFRCGKPVSSFEQEYCYDCMRHPKSFQRGYSLCIYEPLYLKPSLSAIKYKNCRQFMDFYITESIKRLGFILKNRQIDCIVPVPIHPKRFRKRGFNQAALLAKGLSKALFIPYYDNLLVRTIPTLPQKELSPKDRLRNLEHAFSIHPAYKNMRLKSAHILLVDDIYTTGSTMEICSRILLAQGASEITVFSIAIGYGY